jgi:uncharacterized RDD family membrane protein YckC
MGLVVTTGRVGATTGRLVLLPARAVARSPLAAPFRTGAENLAQTGRNAENDARRRLESVAGGVLAAPEAEQVIDGVLAGGLPEAIARSLIEHRVVERVVVEVLERAELERAIDSREIASARETERTEQLVAQVLASPALERILGDALESRLTIDLTDKLVRSEAFRHALTNVMSSPEVRSALQGQSRVLAEELAAYLRQHMVRLDDAAERSPRRWFRRPPRPQVAPGGGPSVPFAGIATRGLALAVDAVLATAIFLTGTAVVGLIVSLVWNPRSDAAVVGTVIGIAGLLVEVAYFAGFWSTAGQTPGMQLMHLKVIDRSGSPPGLARSLLRLAGLALAILLLLTGFLPVLVDEKRRALQDFLAGTTVIYTEDASDPFAETPQKDAPPAGPPAAPTRAELPIPPG